MNESINLIGLVLQASLVVKLVMALLLILSVVSWVIIFQLFIRIGGVARFDERFEAWFWTDSLDKQLAVVQRENERTGLEAIFYDIMSQRDNSLPPNTHVEVLQRRLHQQLGNQQALLESGLATLASIASVSPYIGLFGTVWGIMNAFIGLGQADSLSLAVVAPSIAEALIATALGLFAAIPASLAFNHFTAKANAIYERRSLFAEGLLATLLAAFTKAARYTDTAQESSTQGSYHG